MELILEIWKDIDLTEYGGEDYTGLYQINQYGEIKSLPKWEGNHIGKLRILTGAIDGDGYIFYTLFKNNKRKLLKSHRLVGMIFIPNP